MAAQDPTPKTGAFDPDAYLDSLEPIGWRLGLERMHKLTGALGMPQHRFASIHVVGTNGKSSVVQMTAALLEAHGVRTGACLSPHLARWSERVQLRGGEIDAVRFASAVARTAETAEVVNRSLEEGEAVTQFEVATAAAFVALAAARVDVGVIEAGLGGRLDATNVIPSRVTVLTSVGLDHTEWLGGSLAEIAAEKLAVLRDHSILVIGRTSPEVTPLVEEAAERHGARLVRAPDDPGPGIELRARGAFQRRNFAIARCAAEAFLEPLEEDRVQAVAREVAIPGRLELNPGDPPVLIDAAHNPDGAAALAEALSEVGGGGPVVACIGILADKDAPAMLRALAPAVERIVCTELPQESLRGAGRPGSRPWPASELAEHCAAIGIESEAIADPAAAFAAALREAEARDGLALVAGSHYLLATARSQLEAAGR